jgi:hypothetical protein
VVPDETDTDNRLAVPSPESSSDARDVRALTDEPVNTPRTVSNELPFVLTLREPVEFGVKEYQRVDAVAPATVGSPCSRVADVFESNTVPLSEDNARADAKKSLFPEAETVTEFDNDEYDDVPAEDVADTLNWYVPAESVDVWH